jgi:hypothetical protein
MRLCATHVLAETHKHTHTYVRREMERRGGGGRTHWPPTSIGRSRFLNNGRLLALAQPSALG